MIETREETGHTTLIGRGHKFDDQALWVDAKYRTKIIRMAMRIAGDNAQREQVVSALNDAAKYYGVKLTPHLITIARAARMSEQLDRILDEMRANGMLKYFHQEYAKQRLKRAERGAGFMNFSAAQRRFRNAIIARLVGNRPAIDSGMITRVLNGKEP